jgi:glycosyltransferase involved in cell wall biosynthesis
VGQTEQGGTARRREAAIDQDSQTGHRRVLIAGEIAFPHGTGATARVRAYAKGLMAAGLEVRVVSLRPSEYNRDAALNRSASGECDGISFVYLGGTPFRDQSFVRRRLRDALSVTRFFSLVRGGADQGPANVILFSQPVLWILVAAVACRCAKSACVLEKNEYPFVYARNSLGAKAWSYIYTRTVFRLVDGVLVISTYLEKYFSGRVRAGARVIRIPILVDPGEFGEDRIGDGRGRRILCYVGNLDHPGEVDSLLSAFSEIAARFPEWSLRVIGGSRDPSLLPGLRSRVAGLGLSSRIQFFGSVPHDALPGLFEEVGAFVLPRAGGLFSTAGFPTKLGEYLASGRPVIAAATGDIPMYLRDGVDAFLVPPDNARALADRLADVLSDPEAAYVVGLNGRAVAQREFSAEIQCRRLAAFLGASGGTLQNPGRI